MFFSGPKFHDCKMLWSLTNSGSRAPLPERMHGAFRLYIETELIRAKPESICNSSTFCSSREVLWRKY